MKRPDLQPAWLLLFFLLPIRMAHADGAELTSTEVASAGDAWRSSASLEARLFQTRNEVLRTSLLNPGNRIAGLARDQTLLDANLDLHFEHDDLDVRMRSRSVKQWNTVPAASDQDLATQSANTGLSQGFVRYKSDNMTLLLGRELLTWGPSNFRSPSSPIYFDAGRTTPLVEVPGIDLLRVSHNRGSVVISAIHVFSTSQIRPEEDFANTNLLKFDQNGSRHAVSLILGKQRGNALFVGGFAQYSATDDVLLYAEFGSSRQKVALRPDFGIERPASRSADTLLGSSYTLQSGQVVGIEYLHNSAGYRRAESAQFFATASRYGQLAASDPATAYRALGQALGLAPRLYGRDYLSLTWQSNLQDSKQYWRVNLNQNLTDHSRSMLFHLERNLYARLSAFASLTLNQGGAGREYGALQRSNLSLGVKWFVL
jgi:hypothetical protein